MQERARHRHLAGPTASGNRLAVDRRAISTASSSMRDSMQVHRDSPIPTAQPDAAARDAAPHRLYGALALDDPARRRVGRSWRWRKSIALQRWQRADPSGWHGLYLGGVDQGLSPIPEIPAMRQRAASQTAVEEAGSAAPDRDPAAVDPEMAERRPTTAKR